MPRVRGEMDPDKSGPFVDISGRSSTIRIIDKSKENPLSQYQEEQEENSAHGDNFMKCAVCEDTENAKTCAGCHSVFYCGKEHQKSDWLNHKKLCKSTKIIEPVGKNGIRFWIARRDLNPGEIIFIDRSPQITVTTTSNAEASAFSSEIIQTAFPYNHSCAPNCRFDSFLDQEIEKTAQMNFPMGEGSFVVVRTILPVAKGEELTVGGGMRYQHLGTHYRRQVMRDHHRFICTCKRCKDPTELNSFTSAITCPKCYQKCQESEADQTDPLDFGYFLPINPLEFGGDALWRCGKCGDEITARIILAPVLKIYDELQRRSEMFIQGIRGGEEQELYLEGLLRNLSGEKLLHPNHWLLAKITQFGIYTTDVKNIPVDKKSGLPNYLSGFDTKRLENFVERSSYFLKVREKCSPGWSRTNGDRLSALAVAKFYLANKNNDCIENLSVEQLELSLQENREALEIYKLGVKIERFQYNPKDITGWLANYNKNCAEQQEKMENRINLLDKILQRKRMDK